MIICNKDISIRILEQSDVNLLVNWLSDPQVLEYYEGRDHSYNERMVKEKFYSDNLNKTRCIIEYLDKPIGYLQFYLLEEDEYVEYGYIGSNHIIYGIDLFIGETQYWNQGIGTNVMKEIMEYLLQEKGANKILLDPQCRNKRAIACYEKCGFKKIRLLPENEMHEGKLEDCWMMEYDASGFLK